MAKTSSRSRSKASSPSPVVVDDPPESGPISENEPEPANPTAPPKKRSAGRPIGATTGSGQGKRNLFSKMEGISADDWGTRASVHLYRMEPFTDRLRSGTVVHIMKYSEPIDEDRVMKDHGSGKYRALLNFRKPASNQQDEIDRVEFEILNMNYPPRIPKGEWVEDPRNRKWEWARASVMGEPAAGTAAAASPQQNVVDTFRVFNEIQGAADERAAAKSTGPGFIETIRAVKEILPTPAPPQTENAVLSTIVDLMKTQISAAQNEAKELRQEIRDMRSQPAQQPTNGIDTFKGFVSAAKELLPAVKEMFPGMGDSVVGAVTGRSRMSGWQEFLQPIVTEVAKAAAPVLPVLAHGLLNRNAGPGMQVNPAGQGAAALPAAPANPLIGFLNTITQPMLNYLRKYAAGSDDHDGEMFAEQVLDMYGPTWDGKDWHAEAKAVGLVQLVALYQKSPYWSHIAPMEPKFVEFVTQFLAATPGEDAPGEPESNEVIDLTQEEETGAYV
jgi:hypothetical protein